MTSAYVDAGFVDDGYTKEEPEMKWIVQLLNAESKPVRKWQSTSEPTVDRRVVRFEDVAANRGLVVLPVDRCIFFQRD